MTDILYRGRQKITVLNKPPSPKNNPLYLNYDGRHYQVAAVLPARTEPTIHPQIFTLNPRIQQIVVEAVRESVYGFVLTGEE